MRGRELSPLCLQGLLATSRRSSHIRFVWLARKGFRQLARIWWNPLPRLPLGSHLHDEADGEEFCAVGAEVKLNLLAGEEEDEEEEEPELFGSTLVFHSLPLISQYSMAAEGGLFIDPPDD